MEDQLLSLDQIETNSPETQPNPDDTAVEHKYDNSLVDIAKNKRDLDVQHEADTFTGDNAKDLSDVGVDVEKETAKGLSDSGVFLDDSSDWLDVNEQSKDSGETSNKTVDDPDTHQDDNTSYAGGVDNVAHEVRHVHCKHMEMNEVPAGESINNVAKRSKIQNVNPVHGNDTDSDSNATVTISETDSVINGRPINVDIDSQSTYSHLPTGELGEENKGHSTQMHTTSKPKISHGVDFLNPTPSPNKYKDIVISAMKNPRQRKQLRPKSICKDDDNDDEETFETEIEFTNILPKHNLTDIADDGNIATVMGFSDIEDLNETETKIKQRPLCSRLCTPVSHQKVKHKYSRSPTPITNKTITDIINETIENSNIPCTTNRYRRHFLKQLRKAEAKRKAAESKEMSMQAELNDKPDTCEDGINPDNQTVKDDIHSEDEYIFDGKRIKEDELYSSDTTECNVCFRTFSNVGTFMAHYICHSSFEKEQASLRMSLMSRSLNNILDDSIGGSEFQIDRNLIYSAFNKRLDNTRLSMTNDIHERNSDSADEHLKQIAKYDKNINDLSKDNLSDQTTDNYDVSTYFCHICNRRFTNINALQSHVTDHVMDVTTPADGKRSQYCHLCHKKFASAGSLHVHNKIHTGDTPYSCITCKKSFRDKTRLTTHMRVHTGEKPFICNICYKSFSQKGNLKLHKKIHTGERDCSCSTCGNSFRTKSDLIRHMRVHGVMESSADYDASLAQKGTPLRSPSQTLTLDGISHGHHLSDHVFSSAGKQTTQRASKIKDILEHKGYPNYTQYPFSNTGTDDHSNKQTLTRERHGVKKIKTDTNTNGDTVDGNSNESEQLYFKPEEKHLMMSIDSEVEFIKAMTKAKLHSETVSTPEVHIFKCPLCELTLSTIDNLNHHILSRHNPLTNCGASAGVDWSSVDYLKNIRATSNSGLSGSENQTTSSALSVSTTDLTRQTETPLHQGIKKFYRCQECSLEFTSFPVFQIHLKSHLDLDTHDIDPKQARVSTKCSVCSIVVDPADLMDHIKTHTREKAYSCDFCCKIFRRSHHLQTHMRTHTGDRPYICTDCGKCFSRGDHLQNHKRTHTGEKPYRCDVCDKTYSQSHHLLRHKRTHTGERPYKCVMCVKSFSRDHHLKKHMEIHNVVIFTDKKETETAKGTYYSQHTPSPSATMVTRSSNRIAQLMDSKSTHNPASRLMESMVKKHLQGHKGDHSNPLNIERDTLTSDLKVGKLNKVTGTKTANKTLKLADILDEDSGPVVSQVSNQLLIDHVLKVANRSNDILNTSPNPSLTSDNAGIVDDVLGTSCLNQKNRLDNDDRLDSAIGHEHEESDTTATGYRNTRRHNTSGERDFMELKEKLSKPTTDLLTLEDIVNKRLQEEYNLLDD